MRKCDCPLHSVQGSHFIDRDPFHAVLEKILLPHESQEPESALEVLHFRRCVWGTGTENAGRGVRVELALPCTGYVRHLLKGVGPQQHEQT